MCSEGLISSLSQNLKFSFVITASDFLRLVMTGTLLNEATETQFTSYFVFLVALGVLIPLLNLLYIMVAASTF